jgi:tRNA pseudouridine55 synthase
MRQKTRPDLLGLVNIDKPPGMTSRDVVNAVERLVRPVKAGHAGTLDPLASGVLVIALGRGTRLIEYVQAQGKSYEATFLLGQTSPTLDLDSDVTHQSDPRRPSIDEIHTASQQWTGTVMQRPPEFSAVKVQGKRAYALARRGKDVELEPRPVQIDSIEILSYDYPRLNVRIRCGSGTYIRSLGRDLAEAVGTQAVMSYLRRTAVGVFEIENALAFDQLSRDALRAHLLPLRDAVAELTPITLSDVHQEMIASGRVISLPPLADATEHLAALNEQGDLVAVLAPNVHGDWRPAKNFLAP